MSFAYLSCKKAKFKSLSGSLQHSFPILSPHRDEINREFHYKWESTLIGAWWVINEPYICSKMHINPKGYNRLVHNAVIITQEEKFSKILSIYANMMQVTMATSPDNLNLNSGF